MKRLSAFIKKFFDQDQTPSAAEAEALRLAFKERYHQFKLLLNANNKALEVMSDIEQALQGTSPFGMQFIRSSCTRVSTDVFQIVKHLNALSQDRYNVLFERFKEIQRSLNPLVHPPVKEAKGPLVIPLAEVSKASADLVGPKMANLAELARQLGLTIPDGFVITSSGFEAFIRANDLQTEINRRIQSAETDRHDQLYALSTAIQQSIIEADLPESLSAAIVHEQQRLQTTPGQTATYAVRSSALGEDLSTTSFAGQYRSILNVSAENITAAYKEVVASKYGLPAISYRLNRGIRDEDVPMCVGCLTMVHAACGGVLYTRNPVDIREDTLIINSAWGLPKSVVDGSTATDQFTLRRATPPVVTERHIPAKEQQYVCYPEEGICRLELTGEASLRPSLSDDQAMALAGLGMRIEDFYGAPQDIEWAIDARGRIVILQCRPLQQMDPGPQHAAVDRTRWPVCLSGGRTASSGVAAGKVFIVRKDADALNFPKGAVLVTTQALPRWAALLDRATAVVTEQGSLAGHLANVAREFRVPALFGAVGATRLLSSAQAVTVDAGGRTVYDGHITELLEHRDTPRNLMAGSRVYQLLDAAARHIVPLNLLNPDSPEFRAEKCRTFHDITRFCHEKAVQEMFRFGKRHHFPERTSKQLRVQAAMQWWVLNLDDGFREEVSGQFVEFDNIVSIPMCALWAGITAFPWEGPPPVDGKGFMSVMFQATANQALLPTVRSTMTNRNYFMISRNFCSLQSRLGFHFSIVEALVSERSTENYINFHFKGGGADFSRRIKRVHFVREILEAHGFRVTITQDALTARLEHHEATIMERSLKVLGYIMVHTRQLDMIMANAAMLAYYRQKIETQIAAMLAGAPAGPDCDNPPADLEMP